MAEATGRVVQILGGVVDCAFPPGELPEIYDAVEVDREGQPPLVLEVQRHLGDHEVRTVATAVTRRDQETARKLLAALLTMAHRDGSAEATSSGSSTSSMIGR